MIIVFTIKGASKMRNILMLLTLICSTNAFATWADDYNRDMQQIQNEGQISSNEASIAALREEVRALKEQLNAAKNNERR